MQNYKWLHLYVFSTVSSNFLPEQMQSRIDCTCMLFSRVSFQMCPQIAYLYRCKVALVTFVRFFSRMDFHMGPQTACMNSCKVTLAAFVWCFAIMFFSYVSSNFLSDQRHSHRCCIYFPVPLCSITFQSRKGRIHLTHKLVTESFPDRGWTSSS